MPAIKRFEFAFPAQRFRMMAVAFLLLGDYNPNRVQFAVFAQQVRPAQYFRM
jgi:hypothetical protein